MKIIHIFHNYHPYLGGLELAIKNIAEIQANRGHEVHIITSKTKRNIPSYELINKVHIHRISSWRIIYPDLTIPIGSSVQFLKIGDVVHAHSQNSFFTMRIANQANRLNKKLIFNFMAVDSYTKHPNPLLRSIVPYFQIKNIRKAIRISDIKLVKSKRDQVILHKKYNVKAHYIPDGIKEHYFKLPKKDPLKFKEKFGIIQENFFLFIGRIHKLKGPHVLVKALKLLPKNTAVVFIGPDNGYLRELVKISKKLDVHKRTYFLNKVSEEEKIEAIDSSIAVVVPSISDNVEVFSLVVSEAWARRKPVIASKIGELPYRIKNGVNGILVEPNNIIMLAKAMLELINDEQKAIDMGNNGIKYVSTWNDVVTELLRVYSG